MSNTAPFLHIAYANDNTGTLDFTTTGGVERTYTGFYTDEYTTDSSDPTKYKWLTNAEFKNKVNNAAYAKSADGKDGFTTVYPNLNLLNFNSGVTFGKYYGWAADVTTFSGYRAYFKKVKVTPNNKYTISANWSNTEWLNVYGFTNENDTTAVARYGSAGGLGAGSWDSNFVGGYSVANDMTFTVPANVNYIGVSYASISRDTLTLPALLNGKPKLEQGSITTPWISSITEVKDSDYPQYIGLSNVANPTTFKDYEWTLLESIPKKILNTHVAYANSSDGVTDFTTVYPNLNLLDGTKDFSGNWSNSGNWVNDGIYKGLTVKKRTGQWGGIFKPCAVSTDGIYTFSAYIKSSSTNNDVVRWVNVNNKDTNRNVLAITSNWSIDTLSLTLKAGDIVHVRYEITTQNTTDTLWNAGHKWEEGSVATPYIPSASEVKDSDYPKFVGVYGDDSTTASQLPASYKWSSIPVPGPTPPVVDNVYVLTMPTVKSINVTYGIGTLTTKPVTWLSTKPKLDVNQVLWYKSEITGTDNSVGVYYSNLVGGANLDDGDSPLDNSVVSIVLNNKIVNVPRDLALKLELLSQTLNKRDNELAQLIADTNDRITNIDMGSGQAGLNQEIIDRKNADDLLGVRIDTVTGNVNDLKTTTQTKFTNIEKQLGGFSVQGTKNSSLTRPSVVFNYSAYGSTLPDGSTDGGGRLYYQVPGDTTYNVRELKFNYQSLPSFYDLDQITIWEKSWSNLYGGFPWRDTIITTTDIDTFYIDGMTTYYDHNGDLIIRGKVVMDGIDDWIGSMTNRGFKPDTVVITVASDLKSVKSIRFTGEMGVIEMTMSLGYSAVAQVQRIGRQISFYGSSPIGTFSTTGASWTNLNEKIPYGLRPTRSFEFAANAFGNNNSIQYAFDTSGGMKIHQATSNANQYQVMGQVGWQTFDQYPPSNYASNSAWTNR